MGKYMELVHHARSYLYNKVYSDPDGHQNLINGLKLIDCVEDATFMYNPPSFYIMAKPNYTKEQVHVMIESMFSGLLSESLMSNKEEFREECKRILDRNLGFSTEESTNEYMESVIKHSHLLFSLVVVPNSPSTGRFAAWLTI